MTTVVIINFFIGVLSSKGERVYTGRKYSNLHKQQKGQYAKNPEMLANRWFASQKPDAQSPQVTHFNFDYFPEAFCSGYWSNESYFA